MLATKRILCWDLFNKTEDKRSINHKEESYKKIVSKLQEGEIAIGVYYFKDQPVLPIVLTKERFDILKDIATVLPCAHMADLLYIYAIPKEDVEKYTSCKLIKI